MYPPSYAADLPSAVADMGKLTVSATTVTTLKIVVPILTFLSPGSPSNYCTFFYAAGKVLLAQKHVYAQASYDRHPDHVALPWCQIALALDLSVSSESLCVEALKGSEHRSSWPRTKGVAGTALTLLQTQTT